MQREGLMNWQLRNKKEASKKEERPIFIVIDEQKQMIKQQGWGKVKYYQVMK